MIKESSFIFNSAYEVEEFISNKYMTIFCYNIKIKDGGVLAFNFTNVNLIIQNCYFKENLAVVKKNGKKEFSKKTN
jgi:hypothetical protein